MQSIAYAQMGQTTAHANVHSTDRRPRTRVLIANHQPIVRHGLRALLGETTDLDVVAEADSGRDALQKVRQLRPDVLVIDLLMPDVDGITATRMVRMEAPNTEVVVMTGAGRRRGHRVDPRRRRRLLAEGRSR